MPYALPAEQQAPGRVPREPGGHHPAVVRREARLVRLTTAQQAVLAQPVFDSSPDRVRDQHEAGAQAVERRVAAELVVPLVAAEAERVERGDGPAVELEQPQAQPATLERLGGELAMKRLAPAGERPRAGPPALAVQAHERVHVGVEP